MEVVLVYRPSKKGEITFPACCFTMADCNRSTIAIANARGYSSGTYRKTRRMCLSGSLRAMLIAFSIFISVSCMNIGTIFYQWNWFIDLK